MNERAAPDPASAGVSAEARALLDRYRDLLAEATRTRNLTAAHDPGEIERRHILDAIALARALADHGLLPPGASVIDVGSGGGLPGVPLAVLRPDLNLTLLEATSKKAAFLETLVERLPLPRVRVLTARAEDAGRQTEEREAYDLAVARAVAPLVSLVELTLPLVRVGGWLAAVKGSRAADELHEAAGAIARCGGGAARLEPIAGADARLRLVLVPKVAPVPPDLPRRSGMPVKRPLR